MQDYSRKMDSLNQTFSKDSKQKLKKKALNRKLVQKKERKSLNGKKISQRLLFLLCVAAIAGAGVVATKKATKRVREWSHSIILPDVKFAASDIFPIKSFEVKNSKRVSRDDIITLSGLREGDNLATADLKAVAARIRQNPWVDEVFIRRFYPQTIEIAVTEREPVAIANMDKLYYVDKKGIAFKALAESDSMAFPMVTGISTDEFGSDDKGMRGAFLAAIDLISSLGRNPTLNLADISEIHFDKGYGFTLFTAKGAIPVKLGFSGFGEKISRLGKVLGDIKTQHDALEYIDLNYGDKIIVKKKPTTTPAGAQGEAAAKKDDKGKD